jgi:hypothetical protein
MDMKKDLAYLARLSKITTPVAYLTTIPEDIFAANLPPSVDLDGFELMDVYKTNDTLQHPFPFEYYPRNNLTSSQDYYPLWASICTNQESVYWALKSIGPAKLPIWFGFPRLAVYDPTNGTISYGQIIMVGPGSRFDGPQK